MNNTDDRGSIRIVFLLVLLLVGGLPVFPQSKPPARYIDKGACPFECCVYRKWTVEKTTVLYAQPNKESARVGQAKTGTKVLAITGEVRSVPGKFVVTKAHGKYKPGNVLWVYTPQGEGFYLVWFRGKMFDEELDFVSGPYEKSSPTCEESPTCWGKMEVMLKTDWWVKIKLPNGTIGWTSQADNFGNKDSCG